MSPAEQLPCLLLHQLDLQPSGHMLYWSSKSMQYGLSAKCLHLIFE